MGLSGLLVNATAGSPVGNLVAALFRPARLIGPFATQVTFEEVGEDELAITKHPVAYGAAITDHSYKEPARVLIRCGFSNSSLASIITDVAGIASLFTSGSVGSLNYAQSIYRQMIALQETRIPFNVTTGKRSYKNMLMKRVTQKTDKDSENVLMVTCLCEEILMAQIGQAASVNSNGVVPTPTTPALTNPVSNNGTQSLISGSSLASGGTLFNALGGIRL